MYALGYLSSQMVYSQNTYIPRSWYSQSIYKSQELSGLSHQYTCLICPHSLHQHFIQISYSVTLSQEIRLNLVVNTYQDVLCPIN